jgi:hypothetical protein
MYDDNLIDRSRILYPHLFNMALLKTGIDF